MKSSKDSKETHQEYFHKICVVGGGLTGAIMVLLLKQSKLFKKNEIAWIKPKEKNTLTLEQPFTTQQV